MKTVECLTLANREDLAQWRNPLMKKGYSFRYIEGFVGGYEGQINIGIECVETGEFYPLIWKEMLVSSLLSESKSNH